MTKILFAMLLATVCHGQDHQLGPFTCTKTAVVTTTNSGATQLTTVGGGQIFNATQQVRICQIYIQVVQPGSSPANFGLVTGTGTGCSSPANLTQQWTGVASSIQSFTQILTEHAAMFVGAGLNICLNLSQALTSAQAQILYDNY